MSFWKFWHKPVEVAAPITIDTSEIVAGLEKQLQAERETVGRLVVANRALKVENAGLRADVRQAEAAHDKAAAELATLRPDAQKWRDRKQADRDYRAKKRAKAGELVA